MRYCIAFLFLLLIIPTTLIAALPKPAELSQIDSWQMKQDSLVFSRDKLTDHIDGAAEVYYTYAIKDVTVIEYERKDGESISVDIYDMTNPNDAYGIYSFNRTGNKDFVAVGNGGTIAPGQLDFWVDKYYVRVSAGIETKISNSDLLGVGKKISDKLASQKTDEPNLINMLPKGGLVTGTKDELVPGVKARLIPESMVYFHQKLILNNVAPEVNKAIDLKLTDKTNVVYAEYDIYKNIAKVLVVEYPNKNEASQSLLTQQKKELFNITQQDNYLVIVYNTNKQYFIENMYKTIKTLISKEHS